MGIISLLKLKKYDDYVYRAVIFDDLFQTNKAIQVMESAVRNEKFNKKEIASGYIFLGILYSKIKDYGKASDCYHQGLELVIDEKIFYSSNFKKAIETFVKNGDIEKAKFWLDHLLERQSYDRKFRRLVKLKAKLELGPN